MPTTTVAAFRVEDGADSWERAFALLPPFHGEDTVPDNFQTDSSADPSQHDTGGFLARLWSKLIWFFAQRESTTDCVLEEYWFRMC